MGCRGYGLSSLVRQLQNWLLKGLILYFHLFYFRKTQRESFNYIPY